MSYKVSYEMAVTSLESLRKAVSHCGGVMINSDYYRKHASHKVDVGCVARCIFPNTNYDIGVMKNSDGTYKLEYDRYGKDGRVLELLMADGGLPDSYCAEQVLWENRHIPREEIHITMGNGVEYV